MSYYKLMPYTLEDMRTELDKIDAWLKHNDPTDGPENYYCDGELSAEEADARWKDKVDRRTYLENAIIEGSYAQQNAKQQITQRWGVEPEIDGGCSNWYSKNGFTISFRDQYEDWVFWAPGQLEGTLLGDSLRFLKWLGNLKAIIKN